MSVSIACRVKYTKSKKKSSQEETEQEKQLQTAILVLLQMFFDYRPELKDELETSKRTDSMFKDHIRSLLVDAIIERSIAVYLQVC